MIDGKVAAQYYIDHQLIPNSHQLPRKPVLAILSGNSSKDSEIYLRNIQRFADKLDVIIQHYQFYNLQSRDGQNAARYKIQRLNSQRDLDGIIALNPFPEELRALIDPAKDVEGIGLNTLFRLYTMRNSLIQNQPSTPYGIILLLKYYKIPLDGKYVTIVGRSNTIGRPLFYLMEREGATCTQCHSKTTPLSRYTKSADIVISACGIPNIITENIISPDTIVIDAGINYYNGRLCGDVDFAAVSKKTNLITPVPGGVGPMTNVALFTNLINRCKENIRYE